MFLISLPVVRLIIKTLTYLKKKGTSGDIFKKES